MEYYGYANQVSYDVYVASESAFHSFEFDGYTYICVKSKLKDGIETVQYSGGIRITDRERTLVDCLKDMDRIGGIEETVAAISMMKKLNEKKIRCYLDEYNNQFLFQKAGYVYSHSENSLVFRRISSHYANSRLAAVADI